LRLFFGYFCPEKKNPKINLDFFMSLKYVKKKKSRRNPEKKFRKKPKKISGFLFGLV